MTTSHTVPAVNRRQLNFDMTPEDGWSSRVERHPLPGRGQWTSEPHRMEDAGPTPLKQRGRNCRGSWGHERAQRQERDDDTSVQPAT
jgi:hypothetical protein